MALVVVTAMAAPGTAHASAAAGQQPFGVGVRHGDNCAAANLCGRSSWGTDSATLTAGLLGNGRTTVAVSPSEAQGASYVPDSNVLRLPDGQWRYLPAGASEPVTVPAGDPGALVQIAESRTWLASGTVPGRTPLERSVVARALLSMRLLTQPNGAVAAAWYGGWDFSWPRDSSFVAVAFARTGHLLEAQRILSYTMRTQRADGTWDARTKLDGSGPPDDRPWQLDANGWVPWAVWEWYQAALPVQRDQFLQTLYAGTQKAAKYAAGSLDVHGLPPASPDYWELGTSTPNIGTAAPLLAGLRAAAGLADLMGKHSDACALDVVASRLSDGIATYFAPLGYPRTVDGQHGRDSAVTFMAPPFNQPPTDLAAAIDSTYQTLLRPNGGVIPGNDPDVTWANSWTPATSTFGLAWSTTKQQRKATEVENWVVGQRNSLGELPEQVNQAGAPASVTPLGWADAITVLTLSQLGGSVIPVPRAHVC
ncbi:MAG: hypothetical protein JOZ47_07925 [Kutzneria sp.]|nr:hypothetical protein [Kutzneria sp.]